MEWGYTLYHLIIQFTDAKDSRTHNLLSGREKLHIPDSSIESTSVSYLGQQDLSLAPKHVFPSFYVLSICDSHKYSDRILYIDTLLGICLVGL